MSDPEKSDDARRELSLLALGETLREEPPKQPSKLMQALSEVRAEQDAAGRHRAARSRRDARPNPLLTALAVEEKAPAASVPEPPRPAPAPPVQEPAAPVQRQRDPVAEAQATPRPAAQPSRPAAQPPRATPPMRDQEAEPAGPSAARRLVERSAIAARAVAAAMTSQKEAEPREPPRMESAPAPVAPLAPPRRTAIAEPPREMASDDDGAIDDGQWKPLIDPRKVIDGVRRSRNLIIATTIAGALLGVGIAVSTPKKYQASTELLADPRDLNLVDKELTQTGLSTEATLAIVENQVRILRSGTVLSQVIDRLNLTEDPEFNGTGKTGGIGGMVQAVKSLFNGGGTENDPARRSAITNSNLARALDIERGGKTFVIVIGATTLNGEKSALIANTMTDVFLKAYGQLQSDAAGRAADELTSKLDELRASVEKAERAVETFKAENDIIDPQGRLITDDEIVKLNEQLSVARARTLELNARAASMRSFDVDAVVSGVLPEELASATIQELRAQYSTLKGEADRLAVRLGPRHPQRQAVDAQLNGARDLINAELTRIVSSAQTELKRAVQLEQELSSRLAQLKVRQGGLSNEMVTLRELERDSAAKRAVYEAFLLRARQTGEQRGINSANMSVISKAYPPLNAQPPSRSTIALTGMMLGFMAGLGLGVVRGTYSSLADTANGVAPAPWRRRRRPQANDLRDPTPAPRDRTPPDAPAAPIAAAATTDLPDTPSAGRPDTAAVPPRTASTPTPPASSQTQSAPPTFRDNPMSDQTYASYPGHPPLQAGPAYPNAPIQQPVYAQQSFYPQGYAHPYGAPPQPPMPGPAPMQVQPQMQAQPQMQPPMHGQPPMQGYAQPYAPAHSTGPQPMHNPAYWQPPMPPQGYPYAQPGLQAPQQPHYTQQPVYAQQPQQPFYSQAVMPGQDMRYAPPPQQHAPAPGAEVEPSQIEEIRASLRECRDAIRDLTESRTRRRYF